MKKCTKCGEDKSLDSFNKNKSRKDGLQKYCRACDNETTKERHLRRKYGLFQKDVDCLWDEQDGRCAVCSTALHRNTSGGCNIDHNHQTNEIRGLLCGSCNRAIGYLKDNPAFVRNAYQYLVERGHYGSEAP